MAVSRRLTRPSFHDACGGSEAGFSLLAAIVALGIAGIAAVVISNMTTQGMQGAKSTELLQDLESIKMTLRSRMDCRRTLNILPATTLPTTCPAPLVLRDRNGNNLLGPGNKLGVWTVSTSCAGNELSIGVSKPGKDPLTGRSWSSRPSATDLFGGLSDFCREYLDGGYASCTGTYNIQTGRNESGPVCCRRVQHFNNTAVPYRAIASCNSGEYLQNGGAACHYADTGYSPPPGAEPFAHTSYGDYANARWIADCDQTNVAGDIPAMAFAICCPRS